MSVRSSEERTNREHTPLLLGATNVTKATKSVGRLPFPRASQAAAEQLTRKDAANTSQRLLAEATQDAVTRCVEVSFVVGFWIALSAVGAAGAFLRGAPMEQQQGPAVAAGAAAEGAAGRAAGAAVVLEPSVPSGGVFGQMFGFSQARETKPHHSGTSRARASSSPCR